MKTDSIFYQLFRSSPDVFFDLIGTPSAQTGLYSFISQEVKQTRFQIDGILLPHHRRADLPIYFVEVQAYKQKEGENLYYGFFSEIFLYLNDYRPPNDWRGVLIFTERRFDPRLPTHFNDFANSIHLQRVYLDEMSPDFENRPLEVGAIQLIGVKKELAPERARILIDRARQEVTDATTRKEILELINTIFIYKFPELTRQEIEDMLGLSELKQTRVYQEAKEEGKELGREETLAATLPLLLKAGLTLEQIAQQTGLDLEIIRRVAQQTQN